MSSSVDEKARRIFGDLVVNKRLANSHVVSRLPRFISEYLLSKFCRDEECKEGLEKLARKIAELYPDPREKDSFLAKLKQQGQATIVDEFKVNVDLKKNLFLLEIPTLQIRDALVDDDIVKEYERILSGLWGTGTLRYAPELLEESRGKKPEFTPIIMVDFEPFQVYNIDVDTFIEGRANFTTQEWIELMIQSIGLNPAVYNQRQRLLLLTRLVPLVEGNVNLLEMGPRATGKTYLYRNISYYTRIYAGGTVSAARLFYDMRLKAIGDIGTRDVVIFDEIAKVKFSNPDEITAKLKDFMVEGFFERGTLKRAYSDCSLVFIGNVDIGSEGPLGDIYNYLPNFMKDSAFIDRIHGLLPGWELPKIMKSDIHLATGYGLAADYLSEVFHRFRKISFENIVYQHVELVGSYTIRDEKAVRKLIAGLAKIIFPHEEFNLSEFREIAELAVELRQYIVNELSKIAPSEFAPKKLYVRVRG